MGPQAPHAPGQLIIVVINRYCLYVAVGSGAFLVSSGGGFGLGGTSDNLAGAIAGETFEINEMYPAYMAVAKMQDEQAAVKSMGYAIAAERIHADMYTRAKQAVDAGGDIELGPMQICTNCGHTIEGDLPDKCPICGVKKEFYETFEA